MKAKIILNIILIYYGLTWFTGCTVPGKVLNFYYENNCPAGLDMPADGNNDGNNVNVTYLGAGGYLVRRGRDSLLISPFFSNPGIFRVGLASVKSKPAIIDAYLPPVKNVEAILIGHSHYDHLMDIPYIAKFHAPRATIYGNKTMIHLLAPYQGNFHKLETLNSRAAEPGGAQGEWVTIAEGRIRFMAVKSRHAPHFFGLSVLKKGKLQQDLTLRPYKAHHWVQGEIFTFIIDFMGEDGEHVDFRIHYQDAASSPPWGFPPGGIENIDLAILCAAAFHEVNNYPDELLKKAKPKHIIVGHWENFFRSYKRPPRTVPFTNTRKFIRRVVAAKPVDSDIHVPRPGSCMVYVAPAAVRKIQIIMNN